MKIIKNDLIYNIYFFLIAISFMMSINIFPLGVKWFFNKFFYFLFLSLLLLIYKHKKIISAKIFFIILLYVFSLFFSSLINFGLFSGFPFFVSKGLLYGLMILVFAYIASIFELKKALFPFFVCCNIIIFLSFLVYLGFEPKYYLDNNESLDYYVDIKNRDSMVGFSGIFLNQNTLGIFCFLSLIINYVFMDFKNKFLLLINIFFMLLSFLFLFLTISRGAISSLFLFFLIFSFKFYKHKFVYALYGVLIFCLTIFIFVFRDFFEKLIFRFENDGASLRTEIWENAFYSIEKNFYFGVGDFKYVNYLGHELSAHNAYIQKMASDGIFSFIFWMAIILITLWFSVANIFKSERNLSYLSILFICIVFNQFFESMILNIFNPIALFFILLISIIINNRYVSR